MPSDREPLRILKAEVYSTREQRPDAETYTVHLALNRALTQYERDVINTSLVDRPLGIGGANPSSLPRTLRISDTTMERVAEARDDILAFVDAVQSAGRVAELAAEEKKQKAQEALDAEAQRRKEIADSIDWG
ncbi:hypothetical protein [Mycobacteroides abscessus]|uniref:hypothetical protein n=1 Tax=Mycobacteroides abscessus TaxID=36809 RepID=UPI00092B681E|nr:hypothetical protein [Mycobacteroides abscessus]SHV74076.1 Uncharacterised protein [Mycobacteroides abscessus subsp. abscessus]SHW32867.1 Uncharacterised protein [Mycobacteroides abscessus subsp. abscessus]SHW39442.1 Uncharacterised protein [Mycobacteroides abscessus subsp. abscessus]SHW67578.1 Uncharacterised protein [Mycobacteroides abscessus subsp. abscessus]SHX16873.1 Uncharacterised protein [Mycobacteroides abscessus subsp. abscessus]